MADEAKKEDSAAEGGDEAATPKKKIPLWAVGAVLQLLVILGTGAVFVKITFFEKKMIPQDNQMIERAIASAKVNQEQAVNVDLSEFTVNLPGRHMLKTKIQIEVSSEVTNQAVQRRMAEIKSAINEVLSRRPVEASQNLFGKLAIKEDLRDALNGILEKSEGAEVGIVREVFFTDFILMKGSSG